MQHLEVLNLSYNAIGSFDGLGRMVVSLRSLRELHIEGNPGSTAIETRNRLGGFRALSHLSIGLASESARLYLIQSIPGLVSLDNKPVPDSEREGSLQLNPLDFLRIESDSTIKSSLPFPDVNLLHQVTEKVSLLESEITTYQATISKLETEVCLTLPAPSCYGF